MEYIIIAVIAFLLISMFMNRGAKKQQAERERMLRENLKPGTWVMTQSGFYGRYVETDGEVVILENSEGSESYWAQKAVAAIKEPPFAESLEETPEEETPDTPAEAELEISTESATDGTETAVKSDEGASTDKSE